MSVVHRLYLLVLLAALMPAGCQAGNAPTTPTQAPATPPVAPAETLPATAAPEPTEAPTEEPTAAPEPTAEPTAAPESSDLPPAFFYDLGEATIIQERFPEDSRFREMPVRLNGVIAVPDEGEGPFPVVLIIHGTHPGCPVDDSGIDRWPCDPEVEQRNYAGFEYLTRELADRGYVALAMNNNAQDTFGFGEPAGGERLEQVVELQLAALTEAAAGGENGYGVELAGVPDMSRLTLMGHSRGGEAVNWLAGDFADGPNLAAPETFAERGYGPVNGLLLIAPGMVVFGSEGAPVPIAVIVSGCDGDILDGHGQLFYDRTRTGEMPNPPAVSVFLRGANHNGFNTILGADMINDPAIPDCNPGLDAAAQRQFLVDFAADFLTTLDSPDPAARSAAAARLGMDVTSPAPAELYGLPAVVSSLAAGEDRLPIFVPTSEAELTTNRAGGAVIVEGVATHFCEEGYTTPQMTPGSEPCLRPNVTIPGFPYMLTAAWEAPGAALRFELPEDARDLSGYTTVSLRAAVDPLSPLNAPDATQAFTVRLTDGSGNVAAVATRADEPALAFPAGPTSDQFFGLTFGGLVPLSTIRLPLDGFAGVDLADVTEIAIVFDQTPSGNLFLGDLELVRPPVAE